MNPDPCLQLVMPCALYQGLNSPECGGHTMAAAEIC